MSGIEPIVEEVGHQIAQRETSPAVAEGLRPIKPGECVAYHTFDFKRIADLRVTCETDVLIRNWVNNSLPACPGLYGLLPVLVSIEKALVSPDLVADCTSAFDVFFRANLPKDIVAVLDQGGEYFCPTVEVVLALICHLGLKHALKHALRYVPVCNYTIFKYVLKSRNVDLLLIVLDTLQPCPDGDDDLQEEQ